MTTVSIAMATYNGARFIAEQLDSFRAQTRLPDELVVCDDGSIDGTVPIVEAFAASSPFPVRLYRNFERLGYSANFGRAIGLCSGEIIFISDQDDVWYPDKLATIQQHFAYHPDARVIVNDQAICNFGGTLVGQSVLKNYRRLGYADWEFGPGCCTAIARDLLALLLPFPIDVPFDYWTSVVPEFLQCRMIVEQQLQTYRRHSHNVSGSIFAEQRPGVRSIARKFLRDPAAGTDLAIKLKMIRRTASTLYQRRDTVRSLSLDSQLDQALLRLKREAADHQARLNLLRLPRSRRVPSIMRLVFNGTYKRFRSSHTALKDLLSLPLRDQDLGAE